MLSLKYMWQMLWLKCSQEVFVGCNFLIPSHVAVNNPGFTPQPVATCVRLCVCVSVLIGVALYESKPWHCMRSRQHLPNTIKFNVFSQAKLWVSLEIEVLNLAPTTAICTLELSSPYWHIFLAVSSVCHKLLWLIWSSAVTVSKWSFFIFFNWSYSVIDLPINVCNCSVYQ